MNWNAIAVLGVGWLAICIAEAVRRQKPRLRLRAGSIEVEGGSMGEVERLLALAKNLPYIPSE